MLDAPHLRSILAAVLAASVLGVAGCGDDGGGSSSPSPTKRAPKDPVSTSTTGTDAGAGPTKPPALRLALVGKFDAPVLATAVPGTDLVAVVEKPGRIRLVSGMVCSTADRCPARPVSSGRVVVDLTRQVSTGNEQGLLGMAFHPDWPRDPRIFLDYTDTGGDTHVEAWTLDGPSGT
ncbi:MAG: sugar dehydrogenase, partial [Thermoleophilia bacterium]|nr:sugar dehydrogenase [Thermoleophilia bacterium]